MIWDTYQDSEGNVYKLTTEVEQVIINDMVDLTEEIERLNNIIKEVREWANKTIFYFDFEEEITKYVFDLLYTKQGRELLEILKGEDKE